MARPGKPETQTGNATPPPPPPEPPSEEREPEEVAVGLAELVAHRGLGVNVPLAGLLADHPDLRDATLPLSEWESRLDDHSRKPVDLSPAEWQEKQDNDRAAARA